MGIRVTLFAVRNVKNQRLRYDKHMNSTRNFQLYKMVVALGLALMLIAPCVAMAADASPKQVILIIAPFVGWNDITPDTTPRIWSAAKDTSVGDINARSRVKEEDGQPSLIEGALTISAGAWPMVDQTAFAAYNVSERFEFDTAGEAYGRFMGQPVGDNKIVYLGLPKIIAFNESNSYTIVPGTLGDSIEQAGGVTAAIGNSDLGYAADAQKTVRPAAIVAMNKQGTVRYGDVSESVLKRDPASPFGVRTDLATIRSNMEAVAKELSPSVPALVVVDSGDGYRARQFSTQVASSVADRQWKDSLATLDSIFALAQHNYPDATIIVASQASRSKQLDKEGFGPLIITGMKPGLLISDSTQRAGLVTNLDLAASIYDQLKIEAPVQVLGSPISTTVDYSLSSIGTEDDTVDNRVSLLQKMNNTAIAVDKNRPLVVNTFVTFTVLILLFGAFVIVRADRHWSARLVRWIKRALYLLILLVLAVPTASWLMFLIYPWPSTPASVTLQLLIVTGVVWALAVAVWYRWGQRVPVIFLGALASLVIIVDQLLGAPASFTNFFGYSPIAAFRFYGIGNEGASVLFGAVVIALVMTLDQWPKARWNNALRIWGVPIVGALVMLVSAAPFWGANVGVAAWGTVGFVMLWMLLNDREINFKTVLLMLVIIVAVVGVFILIDRFGSGQETHLAKSISSAQQGGVEQLVEIVARKAQTNLRVLTKTAWAYILVAVVAFLAFMRWRPTGDFAAALETNKSFGDGMTAILVAGLAAYFTEDSGIVLPALMVLYLGCGLVWLMLARVRGRVADQLTSDD